MSAMSPILFTIFAGLILKVSSESIIKGKQYVRHSTTARLVGGPIPQEMLDFLNVNSSQPIVSPIPTSPLGGVPMIITEDVKTVVTRMSIPLNSSTQDNERYMGMLKKFLVKNKISLLTDVPLNKEKVLSISQIETRLQQGEIFSHNLQAVLRDVLINGPELPMGNHAALSHVFRLLQLRRIPVVDMVEHAEELSTDNMQEQWFTILIELQHLIPPYMRSCITYLLESLQTGTLIKSHKLTDIVKNINLKKTSPLIFPTQLIQQIPAAHIAELGESTAALLTTVREHGQMTPKLLRLFLKSVPRNTVSRAEELALYRHMDQRTSTDAERKIVAKACKKGFANFEKKSPSEIFRTILMYITRADFDKVQDYKTMLRVFETPRENYIMMH